VQKKEPWTWVRVKKAVKHEWEHYKAGTRQLRANIRTLRELNKAKKTRTLTRSETNFRSITILDILKIGNLIPIIVIPFAEFALPFILVLWPAFLPTTYESNEQRLKTLNNRIKKKEHAVRSLHAVAPFPVSDPALAEIWKTATSKSPERVTADQWLTAAHAFSSLTLNNLNRAQLLAVADFFGVFTAFGYLPEQLIRDRTAAKVMEFKQDDVAMLEEGLEKLTPADLAASLTKRGVRVEESLPRANQLALLREWITLNMAPAVSPVLLVLSRIQTLDSAKNMAIVPVDPSATPAATSSSH
jgi:LETM1 and EF-hand domain-containing protein 1